MQFRKQADANVNAAFHWNSTQVLMICGLLGLLTLALRFAPLPENFSAFGALAIFCGIFAPNATRWWIPASVLFIADCIGHFAHIPGMGFYDPIAMTLNYVGFASMTLVASAFRSRLTESSSKLFTGLPLATLAGSFSFFLISNFGAWLDPRMQYAKSLYGLLDCYLAAIPFWRSTLTSDLVFTLGFTALAWFFVPSMARAAATANNSSQK